MPKYLIKLYPVYPCDDLQVVNLDILKPEYDHKITEPGFKNIKQEVQQMYDLYNFAVERFGLNSQGSARYNNSIYHIVEAENPVKAVCIFKEKIEK